MSMDITTYYDNLITNLTNNTAGIYVSNVARTTENTTSTESNELNSAALLRGKSLFASKSVKAGETVFVERKLLGIVEPSSSKFVHTCDYCMRALGSLEDQVRFISRELRKKGASLAKLSDDTMPVPYTDLVRQYTKERVALERVEAGLQPQTENWPIADHILDVTDPIICPYDSGDKYCSTTCQEFAFKSYQRVFVNHIQDLSANVVDEQDKIESKDAEEEEEEDEEEEGEEEEDVMITEEESFDNIKKMSLPELVKSLKSYSKETNPLLFLACRAVATIASAWEDEILRIAQKKVDDGQAISLLEVTAGSKQPVVTHEESTQALLRSSQPFLLFSQAPWWAQVQDEQEDAGHGHGHGGHGHSHGGQPCHGHGAKSEQSHGHSHGHDHEENEGSELQAQLFELVQRTVNLLGPILVKFENRVSKRVNVQTLPTDQDEDEPEPPRIESEQDLVVFVNNIPERIKWYSQICRFGPIGLSNAFTLGCIMGMFEMNNIGTVTRSGFLDYVEFVAGELDEDDLEQFRELLTGFYANDTTDAWKDDKYNVSTKKTFAADIRSRKLALKKLLTPIRWNNLLKRSQEHPLGSGLYAIACCMNHSCVPNVVVMKQGDGRDDVSCFIALKDIEAHDELCISYIDDEDRLPTEVRQEALMDYLFQCRCPKCTKPKVVKKKVVTKKKPTAGPKK